MSLANKKNKALMQACRDGGNEEAALKALKPARSLTGRKIPAADVNHVDEYGRTPLMRACEGNAMGVVRLLLEQGARADVLTYRGTALHSASRYAYKNIMQMLLEKGAPLEGRDGEGNTPLMLVIGVGEPAVTAFLLERGAAVNVANNAGTTALMMAAKRKDGCTLVKVLLDKGANAQVFDSRGQNALMSAAYAGANDVISLLLERGVDIHMKRGDGRTALMIAAASKEPLTAALLLAKQARVDERDNQGNTALHLAAGNDDFASVAILLEHGADIDARNSEGMTALMIAAERGQVKIVEALLEKDAATDTRDIQGVTALGKSANSEIKNLIKSYIRDTVRPAASVAGSGSAALEKDGLDAAQAEHWRPIGDFAIDHLLAGPDSPKILSNIFNFASRQYISTCRNTATGLQEATLIGNLEDFPNQDMVRTARQKLLEMGKNPPAYDVLEKPQPAGLTKGRKTL